MAKDKENKEQVVEVVKSVDFVQLVKDATQAHGASNFLRVNLNDEVTKEGLEQLNAEYSSQGYEVFSNGKSVLLLKQ